MSAKAASNPSPASSDGFFEHDGSQVSEGLEAMDVIVLAGGQSTRMGSDKAQMLVDGTSLLDRTLGCLPAGTRPIVVSAQPRATTALVVSEDPPFGGPVAGIAAALPHVTSSLVAVVAVDAPASPALLKPLYTALLSSTSCRTQLADVAVITTSDGILQPLCALWRTQSLLQALKKFDSPRDLAAKKLIRAAPSIIFLPGDGNERDYDTPEELAELGRVIKPL